MRFTASRCPEVVIDYQGRRQVVFDASAIARQLGVEDRVLVTPRALDAFVPLRLRTDDHQMLHIVQGLRFLFPLDRSATRYAWESRPGHRGRVLLRAEFGEDDQGYRFVVDVNEPNNS